MLPLNQFDQGMNYNISECLIPADAFDCCHNKHSLYCLQVSFKRCDSRKNIFHIGANQNKTHGDTDYKARDDGNRSEYVQ